MMIAKELLEEAAVETARAFKGPERKTDSFLETDKHPFMLVSENEWLLPLGRIELLSEF